MSDIALIVYKCSVCGSMFWSYTECKIIKTWDNYEQRYYTKIVSDVGTYEDNKIGYNENSNMPIVYNQSSPITDKRKCVKCRKSHQLEEYA